MLTYVVMSCSTKRVCLLHCKVMLTLNIGYTPCGGNTLQQGYANARLLDQYAYNQTHRLQNIINNNNNSSNNNNNYHYKAKNGISKPTYMSRCAWQFQQK